MHRPFRGRPLRGAHGTLTHRCRARGLYPCDPAGATRPPARGRSPGQATLRGLGRRSAHQRGRTY
eukprot:13131051-Heterocapsa_arctica.AAC.1